MSRNAHFRTVGHSLLFCLLFTTSVHAAASIKSDAPPPNSESKGGSEEPPVTAVVSAARREIPIEKSTRSVTVITHEEIERSGKIFLIDLLRGVPGVNVVQLGGYGREAHVFIRGLNKESTLVMMDGVQINNSNQALASLQNITTNNIERIEIIRGSQSVLYGADAVGGLINIVTKTQEDKGLHGGGVFSYGTFRSFYEEGHASEKVDKVSLSGSGSRLDTDGLSENDDYENTTARAHAKWQTTENSDLDVTFNHYNSIVGIDDGVISGAFRTDPNSNTRSNQQVLSTKYTMSLADWWQQYVQYSLFHDASFSHDPRNPGTSGADPESFLQINSNRHTLTYQSDFYIRDFDVLTAGYEYENSGVHTTNYLQNTGNHGWFLQNELTLWKIWTIVAGIRMDKHELYGFEASPLFSTGLWIEKTQTKLKGSFGRAFRAPTFNQLFFPNFGVPTLEPEKSWTWDGGFEQFYWNKRGSFSATYFGSRTRNLIQNLTLATNIGSVRSTGVELEHRIRVWKELHFVTTYTYTHSIDRATDKRLSRVPRHMGKFGLTYDWWRLHFTGDWFWEGSREDRTSTINAALKPYEKLDFSLFYDLTKYFQVYGRIENATNDEYFEAKGFNTPHTGFYTGVKGDF